MDAKDKFEFINSEFKELKSEISLYNGRLDRIKTVLQFSTITLILIVYLGVLPIMGSISSTGPIARETAAIIAFGAFSFATAQAIDGFLTSRHINLIGCYLRQLEDILFRGAKTEDAGWESFLRSRKSSRVPMPEGSNKSSFTETFRTYGLLGLLALINFSVFAHQFILWFQGSPAT